MKPSEEKERPVYQQIVAEIRDRIALGQLEAGSRLPSMRRFAQEKGVSLGTVRHVYALLEQEGLIELRRGQGSFIALPQSAGDLEGRKEMALDAIDRMIRDLTSLGFSIGEARIFFDLRLRQKEDATRPIRIAVVAATPEERSIIGASLDKMEATSAYRLSFNDVISRPERLAAGFDLIASPASLAGDLRPLAPDQVAVMPVAVTVSPQTQVQCRQVAGKQRLGILTVSQAFGPIIREACLGFLPPGPVEEGRFGDLERTSAFIDRQDLLLLSPNYANLVETGELALLRAAEAQGKTLIRTHFDCDQGSLLYLGQAISERYRELRGFFPR